MSQNPKKPSSGYKVLLKRGVLKDASREDREVPYKIYYPSDHEQKKLPLIIWSHGFGGNQDGASFLSRHLAENGYIVLHPTHRGTDSSLWEGKPGHPWDILANYKVPRADSLHRILDIPFILGELPTITAEIPEIHNFVDEDRFGMSGHSFGALTTQIMAGQLFPDENEELQNFKEERFKAFIAYSPVPIGHLYQGDEEKIYGPIDGPILFMTGTEDGSPLDEFKDYKHRLVVHDHAETDEKFLHILEGGDHMVYNGTRGKLGDNPHREQHEEEIKAEALNFWDRYLR